MMLAVDTLFRAPFRWIGTLVVLALGVGVTGVVGGLLDSEMYRLGMEAGPFILGTASCLGGVCWVRARANQDPRKKRRQLDAALLVPCALAPAAVVSPLLAWRGSKGLFVLMPGLWFEALPHAPIEEGWLWVGGAQLASCVTPGLLALYAALSAEPRPVPVSVLSAAHLLGYLPALAIHDGETLLASVMVVLAGPYLGASRDDIGELPGDVWLALEGSAGAWLRLGASLCMLALTARVIARRSE